jgi:hypothetical protein
VTYQKPLGLAHLTIVSITIIAVRLSQPVADDVTSQPSAGSLDGVAAGANLLQPQGARQATAVPDR